MELLSGNLDLTSRRNPRTSRTQRRWTPAGKILTWTRTKKEAASQRQQGRVSTRLSGIGSTFLARYTFRTGWICGIYLIRTQLIAQTTCPVLTTLPFPIFGGFFPYAKELENNVTLRAFHEVMVLEPDQQYFEYVACHLGTGMLVRD